MNEVTSGNLLFKYRVLIILLLIIIFFSVFSDNFRTIENLLNILLQISINGIIALGLTLVLLTGEIDISFGAVVALCGAISVGFQIHNTFLGILISLLVGMFIGFINGFLVTKCKINSFIVTFGMMTIIRGVVLMYTGGRPISGVDARYTYIAESTFLKIPTPFWIFFILLIVAYFFLSQTNFGRSMYAIGGNSEVAKLSGINVIGIKLLVFIISGFMAALSGIILSSRLNTGSPAFGESMLLPVIAAVVLGGTSLAGGVGGVFQTFIGVLILGILANGFNLLNVYSYLQTLFMGIILVIVVITDALSSDARARRSIEKRVFK